LCPPKLITKHISCILHTNIKRYTSLTYNDIDDYLEGKEVPNKVKEIIEGHYLRSEHKRNLPVTVFDFYNI